MNTEAEQMEAALDGLGIEDIVEEAVEEAVEETIQELAEETQEEELPENPPGYLDAAAWEEKHGNLDGFKGKDAYSAEYDRIQENKEMRSELKEMTSLLKTTVAATNELNEQAYQRGLAVHQEELKEALENNDAQGVQDARNKMDELVPPKQTAQKGHNPVHVTFFSSNPVIDQGSSQFDGELMSEFERIYNGKLRADGVAPDQQLSERAIKGYMSQALKGAKELFPEKFESPRNKRSTTSGNQRRPANQAKPAETIKNMKVTTKNPRDNTALMDTYNMIKDMKGGGQEAADAFAKKMNIGA